MHSYKVVGVFISNEPENVRLINMSGSWEESGKDGRHSELSNARETKIRGLASVIAFLKSNEDTNTQYVFVYDVALRNKLNRIARFSEIIQATQCDTRPKVMSIGDESDDEMTEKFGFIKKLVVDTNGKDLLEEVVKEQVNQFLVKLAVKETAELENAARAAANQKTDECSAEPISMMVLSGFIAAAGLAAIAIAFTLLNAASLGLAGLVVAAVGVAALVGGVGLFAHATLRDKSPSNPEIVDELAVLTP